MSNSASHAGLPYPVRGARYSVWVGWIDSDGDPTDPTSPDTEVSLDGAAFTDATEEVTVISGLNGSGYVTLTGAETNCSLLALAFKGTGPKASIAYLTPRVLPALESGAAAAGAAGSITLAVGAAAYDLRGCIVRTTGGTGGGGTGGRDNQARVITQYNPSTRVATVAPNWETIPDNSTSYEILLTDCGANALWAGGSVLSLKQLAVNNSTGDAISAISSGGNGQGISASGNGSGAGLLATGGATGNGLRAVGGTTMGAGLLAAAPANGSGIVANGGGGGDGFQAVGANGFVGSGTDAGSGILATGGDTGHGLSARGGPTSGDGLHAEAMAEGDGIQAVGAGAGVDINADNLGAAAGAAMTLTVAERNAIADAHFARALPGTPATGTAGEALVGARAQAFGRWTIAGDVLTLYAPNGTTVLKTLALTPAGGPYVSRT
jgi:hypothetical protein